MCCPHCGSIMRCWILGDVEFCVCQKKECCNVTLEIEGETV